MDSKETMEGRFEREFGGSVPNTGLYSLDQIDETANVKRFVSSELSLLVRELLEKKLPMFVNGIRTNVEHVFAEDIEAVCRERGIEI